ncbi:MAG: 30S ribosomal protein S18 [Fimbriimonadia bacterium]|jgi:small subunit ribosomal protein S18
MSEEPITETVEESTPVPAETVTPGEGTGKEEAPRQPGTYRSGPKPRDAESLGAGPRDRQRRFKRRRKICAFCIEKARVIDHKEVPKLRRFLTERGKIMPRRQTGTCARHQRMLATAIRRARECALLPYVAQ